LPAFPLTVYTYDFDNNLSQTVVPAGKPNSIEGTHTYQYDAFGRQGGPDIALDVWVAEQQEASTVHEAVHRILK
jgi:hypothetical protein